jgi:hypothetical protein
METMNLRVIHKTSPLFEEDVAFTGFLDMPGYSVDDCRELIVKYERRLKRLWMEFWRSDANGFL